MDFSEATARINAVRPQPSGGFLPIKRDGTLPDIDLSIIVPVYNLEKYVDECLRSIFSQETDYLYEVIIVDDGSKDASAAIIENYRGFENAVLIHKENGGPSTARNAALDRARGRYIMFVDGDDLLMPGCINTVLKTLRAHGADIVQFRHRTFGDGIVSVESDDPAAVIEGDIPPDVYSGLCCAKCFARELVKQVRFPVGYHFEDTVIQYLLFGLCRKFVCIEDVFYGYRLHPVSISATAKGKPYSLDTYWVTLLCIDYARRNGIGNAQYLYELTLRQFSCMQRSRLSWLPEEDRKAIFVLFADYIANMRHPITIKKGIMRDIDKAFMTRDYLAWKLCSAMLA